MRMPGLVVQLIKCILIVAVFTSAACTKADQTNTQPVAMSVAAPAQLATISDDERPVTDAGAHASSEDKNKQPTYFQVEMNPLGRGVAYIAKVGEQVRVVHNGKPGKSYAMIESHTLTVSPDGQRVGYAAKTGDKWVVVDTGHEYGPFDEKGPPVFSPDSRHFAYEAKIGGYWYVFVDGNKSEWAVSFYNKPVFNADSSKVLLVEVTKDDGVFRQVVTDTGFKQRKARLVKNPEYVYSPDKQRIASVEKSGDTYRVIDFTFNDPDTVHNGPWFENVSNLSFSKNGSVLAYLAKKNGKSYLVMNDREEQIPEGMYPWAPVIRPDLKGAGIVIDAAKKKSRYDITADAFVYHAFSNAKSTEGRYKECADLTYSSDGRSHAYVAIKNERFLIVVNGKEGPVYDRTITPQFSPDGKFLVYRARKDNKRFVVVADGSGRVIREHPRYDIVFETLFTDDGKSVAYGVVDGKNIMWKVEKL